MARKTVWLAYTKHGLVASFTSRKNCLLWVRKTPGVEEVICSHNDPKLLETSTLTSWKTELFLEYYKELYKNADWRT